MLLRIPWDKYEAVILLDGWLKTKAGIPKNEVINLVSYQLRQKAINQGIEIDSVFRNTNGIKFQLMSMASAFEATNMGKAPSKLFLEIVEIYHNDNISYMALLKEAMQMIESTSETKSDFIQFAKQQIPTKADKVITATNYIEQFAIATKALPCSFFDILTDNTIYILRKKVLNHKVFIVRYRNLQDYAVLALSLLESYVANESHSTPKEIDINKKEQVNIETKQIDNISFTELLFNELLSDEIIDNCNTILSRDFEDGYQIGDYMHQMRFLSCYEDLFNDQLKVEINQLDDLLKRVGETRDGRVFLKQKCESTLLSSIYSDITDAFENGARSVYIECIYERYSDNLASEMSVYNVDALKDLMRNDNNFPTDYRIERSAIVKNGINSKTEYEIRNVLQSSHTPLTYEDIKSILWYVPMRTIRTKLVNLPEVVNIDKGTYFFAPNLYISADEKIDLIKAMHSAIYSKGYIVAKDLREIFRNACPSAALDSEYLKDHAIREILKVILKNEFDFSSSVITEKGNSLDIGQAYQNFASEHERLTLQELKEFQKELGIGIIYWNNVLKEMIRISSTEMIHKSKIQFDVEAVDNALEMMYPNEYTSLKDITLFLSLPATSVRWNGFVLESYLRDYSRKFRLVQMSVSNDDYFGVMLKNTSKLETYNDVAADMLAKNESWTDEKSALRCLVDNKFQKRAQNSNISAIVKAARQKRVNP